jgi:hypothetical protein
VLVDEGRDDGDRDDLAALVDDLGNLLVLDPHYVLTVYLEFNEWRCI